MIKQAVLLVVMLIFISMEATCKCGNLFRTTNRRIEQGRGKFCSKECKYKYRIRPKGLIYVMVKDNPTSFKKGQSPWNKDTIGLMPKPHNFKDNDVGYDALHDWVNRYKGKACKCEECGENTGRIEWANKSHEYKRDLSDWISLCKKCHVRYDMKSGNWGLATKKFDLPKRKKI